MLKNFNTDINLLSAGQGSDDGDLNRALLYYKDDLAGLEYVSSAGGTLKLNWLMVILHPEINLGESFTGKVLLRFGVVDFDLKEFVSRLKQKTYEGIKEHGYGRWQAIVDDKDLRIQEVICQELNLPIINLPVAGQAGSQVQDGSNTTNTESAGNQTQGNGSGNSVGGPQCRVSERILW
ncbi:hypothetical protein V6N13_031423 [Hibiscus sabdariffa]